MWRIRNIEIHNQVVVGPMAGVSNIAFRSVAKEFGAGLIYTEMVSDKAIVYQNERTLLMTEVDPDEHPLSMQLFGEDIESMVKAAIYLDTKTDCDIIDINMGCPVNKIVKGNGGASLMKTPLHAATIVKEIVKHVSKPVTVKIRAGWDVQSKNAVKMAQLLEEAGASAIAIHGRTRSQMYEGSVDWDIIRDVKQAVNIPVIGNGNIFDAKTALDMLEYTGCDAIMVARGVLGNPWLIQEILVALQTGNTEFKVDTEQRFVWARQHAQRLIQLKGENIAMKEMRSHASWYIAGLPHSHKVKNQFSQMTTFEQFDMILVNYIKQLAERE